LAKRANLKAMQGERDSALAMYLRAEQLAREAVLALPNNTDASRDLSICYGMRGLFLAEGGDVDSGLAVYDRGMKISEELAAKDPDDALQQHDVADGHFEIGTMLLDARRYEDAERRFGEAFTRYERLAAADSGNAETRASMARSGWKAGEACQALWQRARSNDERTRIKARALTWLQRSQQLYARLEQGGMLIGEEATAPKEVDRLLATLRSNEASAPNASPTSR